jgi:hypothetical protein
MVPELSASMSGSKLLLERNGSRQDHLRGTVARGKEAGGLEVKDLIISGFTAIGIFSTMHWLGKLADQLANRSLRRAKLEARKQEGGK